MKGYENITSSNLLKCNQIECPNWFRSHSNLIPTLSVIGNVSNSTGILMLNGENDSQTPVQQAFLLQQRLTDVNHPDHTLITYPNLGHVFYPSSQWSTGIGPIQQYVLADIYSWLEAHSGLSHFFITPTAGNMSLWSTDTGSNSSSGTNNSSSLTEAVQLGAPFYVQHYKANLGKPEPSNETIAGNLTGQGIINGNLNISAEVNYTRTFRDNDTAFLQGDTKFVAENEDTAVYRFDAITNYDQDGTSDGSGGAVFDDGGTGDLSFLSNSLAIYKNRVDSNGNGTFLMWFWKVHN